MSFQYATKQNKISDGKNDIQTKNHKHTYDKLFNFQSIQPKLKVSQPDDIYEQEADRVADQIMRVSEDKVQRKCSSCQMEDEELKISRKVNFNEGLQISDSTEQQISNIKGGGQPLDNATRNFMESRFGYDFSKVRIHTDEKAARSAESLEALAYATGNSIVFGKEQFSPRTNHGRLLLAHELTHVIQQTSKDNQQSLLQRQHQQGQVNNNADADLRRAMQLEHVPADWHNDLNWIMMNESGGHVGARNPHSTASGLFQLTRANWHLMPHGEHSIGNGTEEAQGGIRYIRQRYGNAHNARIFWQNHHWY